MITWIIALVLAVATVTVATFIIAFLFTLGLCLIFGLKLLIRIPIGIAIIFGTICFLEFVKYAFKKNKEE